MGTDNPKDNGDVKQNKSGNINGNKGTRKWARERGVRTKGE